MTASKRMGESIAEHFRIVAALSHGDGEAASAEMRAHITRTAASADIIVD
jgi:DNA-binding GntR family transcriptional regulator